MRLFALLLLSMPLVLRAQDSRLDSIRALLEPMRKIADGAEARGATPALTKVKHQLRDWIESRLNELVWNGTGWRPNPTVLQEKLNDELSSAGLFCGSRSKILCPDWSNLGFLEPIAIEMKNGALIIQTSVGIQTCGVDQSAYAYEYDNANKRWRRFWETEQDDYSERKYFPQAFVRVEISPVDYSDRSAHLILTMGTNTWCTSTWHPLYYRVWQIKGGVGEPSLLLDGSQMAHIAEPIHGRVGTADVLLEYVAMGPPGIGWDEIRHYRLEQGRLVEADPVALTPTRFVWAWLGHSWAESSLWSSKENLAELQKWHGQRDAVDEFPLPPMRCKNKPGMWQVSTFANDDSTKPIHFQLLWQPPYHFTMVSAGSVPDPSCDEQDPEADRLVPLFPDQ